MTGITFEDFAALAINVDDLPPMERGTFDKRQSKRSNKQRGDKAKQVAMARRHARQYEAMRVAELDSGSSRIVEGQGGFRRDLLPA